MFAKYKKLIKMKTNLRFLKNLSTLPQVEKISHFIQGVPRNMTVARRLLNF